MGGPGGAGGRARRGGGAPARVASTTQERHAILALAAAGCAAWTAPLVGLAPWWPFAAVVAITLALQGGRPRLLIPWQLATQVAGLVVVTQALAVHASVPPALALPGLAGASLGIGAVAALVNNPPASVWATALIAAGPGAYTASIGLAVGALATPQGSVAALLAGQLTGQAAPPVDPRGFAPLAAAGVLVATLVLWATLSASRALSVYAPSSTATPSGSQRTARRMSSGAVASSCSMASRLSWKCFQPS